MVLPSNPARAQNDNPLLDGNTGNGRRDNPLLNPDPAPDPEPDPGPGNAADSDPADAPAPESIQRLDLEALLLDERVLSGRIEDPVWQFETTPGRRLVQVPIRIDPVEAAVELDQPAIQLRGGRFVGWRIVLDQDPNQRSGRRGRGLRVGDSRQLDFSNPRLFEGDLDPAADGAGAADPRAVGDAAGGGVPDGAPRISREVTVTPAGTVTWELDRAFGGAEVKAGQEPYLLRLRPDRMRELEPQRPEVTERGANEDIREYQQRRRQQQQAYREEQMAFRELRELVRELPDKFEAPRPARLWAIYDMTEAVRDLSLDGPEPLPWRVGFEQFEALRETATMSVGNEVRFEDYKKLNRLAPIARDPHPYSHRMLAFALSDAQLVGKAQPKDPLHRLIEQVVAGPDDVARRIVLADLVRTVPPTPSTKMLLADAAEHLTPQMKLASLRGALDAIAQDPQQTQAAITAAADALADPQGPPAGGVLDALNEALGARQESHAAVISGINLADLPEDRRDNAIAYLIRSAGQSELCADWLAGALLGSNDPQLIQRTLELIAAAGPGSAAIGRITEGLTAALFGPPTREARNQLDLTLEAPLPLDSPSHPLFRSLNAGNPEQRELAWRALPNFKLSAGASRSRTPDTGEVGDPLEMVMVSALGRAQTPPQVVPFVANLEDEPRSTAALVRLVVEADQAASRRAVNALFGDAQRRLVEPIGALSASERQTFAARVYQAKTQSTPLVVGLMREPTTRGSGRSGGFVNWFAARVQAGELPRPAEWSAAASGDEALLNLAASRDEALAAGAVAALVAGAGGDTLTAQRMVESFAAASDRTVAALTTRWQEARQAIYRARIKQAEGSYRLVLRVPESPDDDAAPGNTGEFGESAAPQDDDPTRGPAGVPLPFNPDAPAPTTGVDPADPSDAPAVPMTKLVLGVIDLIVEGDQVRLSNDLLPVEVPNDHLAIRVTSLVGLARFDDAQDFKLDLVTDPVDLLPQPDGTWRGRFTLPPHDHPAELSLEPTEPNP
jgi:hypothetical protein